MCEEKFTVLERGKTFTLTTLASYLNETHGKKKSGKPFSAIDTHKYLERGHLPEYLGGNKLERVKGIADVKIIKMGKPVFKRGKEQKTKENDN